MEPTTPGGSGSSVKVIALVIGAVVIIGGGFALMRSSSPIAKVADMGEQNPTSQMMSFKQLLGMRGGQKCTFTESSDISRSSGTFYTSDGKGRGDFESTVLAGAGVGVTTLSHMITDGTTMYVWDDETKQGMKISMNDIPEAKPETTPDAVRKGNDTTAVADQWNQTYDYDCDSWKADASLFIPPAEIQFMDMNEMMKGMPAGMMETGMMPSQGTPNAGSVPGGAVDMERMMAGQCAACDQAGDARAECRAALGCE